VTGYNPYQYANSNPTTFSDPSGHLASLSDFGGGIAGAVLYLAYIFECFLDGGCRYKGEFSDSTAELVRSTVSTAQWTMAAITGSVNQLAYMWPTIPGPHLPSPGDIARGAVDVIGDALGSIAGLLEAIAGYTGWETQGACLPEIKVAVPGFAYGMAICAVLDSSDNWGVALSQVGVATFDPQSWLKAMIELAKPWGSLLTFLKNLGGGLLAFANVFSQADSIYDLNGPGVNIGMVMGAGIAFSGTVTISKDQASRRILSVTSGSGVGAGLFGVAGPVFTSVVPSDKLPGEWKQLLPTWLIF